MLDNKWMAIENNNEYIITVYGIEQTRLCNKEDAELLLHHIKRFDREDEFCSTGFTTETFKC